MDASEEVPSSRRRHVWAAVAGVVALAMAVGAPAGLLGDLASLVVAVAALLFAMEASRRPGPLRALAISGALLAGLVMVAIGGVFVIDLTRTLGT